METHLLIAITADSHPYMTIWSCYGNDCIMNIQNFSNETIRDRNIWSEFWKVISSYDPWKILNYKTDLIFWVTISKSEKVL